MSFNVKNIICGYSDQTVVNDISFEVKEGEFCALLGLNGCGKTTLLKSVCGLIPIKKGSVFANEKNCLEMNEKERAKIISFIPQRMSPISGLTALDVVLMGFNPYLKLLDKPGKEHKTTALDSLEKLGLVDIANKDFSHLSEGIKQLVILARTMVQNTPVMLMDEPDSALDYVNKNLVLEKISQVIRKEGKCGLISIHDPLAAIKYCDRLLFMKDGEIFRNIYVKQSSKEEIKRVFESMYNGLELFSWDDFKQQRTD